MLTSAATTLALALALIAPRLPRQAATSRYTSALATLFTTSYIRRPRARYTPSSRAHRFAKLY